MKSFNRQYKNGDEETDLEKAFPDPPFTQFSFDVMKTEVAEIKGTMINTTPTLRELWIVKNGGGRLRGGYGLAVNSEYPRLSKKWNEFTEWQARKDFAEGKKLEDLEKTHLESINKL